jgi:hypothetical protein
MAARGLWQKSGGRHRKTEPKDFTVVFLMGPIPLRIKDHDRGDPVNHASGRFDRHHR